MPTRLLRSVLAENTRALRDQAGLSQEELAQRIQALGLPWVRATVGKVETERRAVTVEDLLALSAAMAVPVSALLQHDGLLQLHPDGLALSGLELIDRLQKGRSAWPEQTVAALQDWQARYPEDDTVRHAAKRLGQEPYAVAAAAQTLYRRTLSDERDRRVTEGLPDDAGRETLRARRGHVMRTLLVELAAHFAARQATDEAALADATERASRRRDQRLR